MNILITYILISYTLSITLALYAIAIMIVSPPKFKRIMDIFFKLFGVNLQEERSYRSFSYSLSYSDKVKEVFIKPYYIIFLAPISIPYYLMQIISIRAQIIIGDEK